MKETRIIQVENDPSVINRANETWGIFGWDVLSVQVTHSQNTETYSNALDYYTGALTVKTTTINYVTITYQRDKEMDNYERLAALQQELENLVNENVNQRFKKPKVLKDKDVPIMIGLVIGGILVVSVLLTILGDDLMWLLVIPYTLPVLYYKKKKSALETELEETERKRMVRRKEIIKRCEQIEEEARQLSV